MDIKEILANSVERIKEYAADYQQKDNGDFNSGVLLGLTIALGVLQNDISTLSDKSDLREYGLDINVENTIMSGK